MILDRADPILKPKLIFSKQCASLGLHLYLKQFPALSSYYQCSISLHIMFVFSIFWQTKPVVLPETSREKKSPHVPEFVRNVMGSSAGAGSGEFHVYRHLRRKEHFRQKFIQEKAEKVTSFIKYLL